MKTKNCPGCGADLELVEGAVILACSFCGCRVELPNEMISTLEIVPDEPDPLPIEVVAEVVDEHAGLRRQLKEKLISNQNELNHLYGNQWRPKLWLGVCVVSLVAAGIVVFFSWSETLPPGIREIGFYGGLIAGGCALIFFPVIALWLMTYSSAIENLEEDSEHLREAIEVLTPGYQPKSEEGRDWNDTLAEKIAEFALQWVLD